MQKDNFLLNKKNGVNWLSIKEIEACRVRSHFQPNVTNLMNLGCDL